MVDERGLKSLRRVAACMLIAMTVVNLILTLNYIGYEIAGLADMDIEEATFFFAFSTVGISIGSIFNRPKIMEEETIEIVKRKSRWTIIGFIIYGAYIVFTFVIVKNIYFITFSVVMMGMYINVVLLSRALYSYTLTDRQRLWREATKGASYELQESNLLWRFKVWIRPFERVAFRERNLGIGNIIICIFLFCFFADKSNRNLVSCIFLFIFLRSAFSILESILGLYTSMKGVCTGVKEFEADRHRNNGGGITITVGHGRRYYWRVYVTDFKNKREITYKTYKCPFITEGDEVKVVHGILSKSVILVNGIKVD